MCACRRDQACHGDILTAEWDAVMPGQADILTNLKRTRQGGQEKTDPHPPQPPPKQPAIRTRGAGQGFIILVELFSGICTATFAL